MKILGGFGDVLSGKLLLYDALSCRFTSVKLRPRSKNANDIEKLIDYEQFCGAKATDNEKDLDLLGKISRSDFDILGETSSCRCLASYSTFIACFLASQDFLLLS